MRKILFRGKDIDSNKWVYGFYEETPSCCIDPSMVYRCIRENTGNLYTIYPETLGQFTGLYDKNSKEIFEGDIIDIHQTVNGYNQFVIEYDKYKFNARYYDQNTKEIRDWYNYNLDELFEINEYEYEKETVLICPNCHYEYHLIVKDKE